MSARPPKRKAPAASSRCECCKPIGVATPGRPRAYRCSVDGYIYVSEQPLTCGEVCRKAQRANLEAMQRVITLGGTISRSPIDV